MNDQDLQFLGLVKEYVNKNPELLPFIVNYATQGVLEKNKELSKLAVEFETIAVAACAKRWHNDRLMFIKQKLELVKDKTSMCWDWLLNK